MGPTGIVPTKAQVDVTGTYQTLDDHPLPPQLHDGAAYTTRTGSGGDRPRGPARTADARVLTAAAQSQLPLHPVTQSHGPPPLGARENRARRRRKRACHEGGR